MNEWKCISQSTQTVKKPLTHMYRWDNNNGGMVEIKKLVFILFVQSQQFVILFSIVQ